MAYTPSTAVPTLAQLGFGQWERPDAPAPRLASPISASDTTVTFTSAFLDHNGVVFPVDTLIGIERNDGYVETVLARAAGWNVSGTTNTMLVRGIRLEGLDWTTSDPTLASDFNEDSAVFGNISGVIQALNSAGLTAQIGANIKFNGRPLFMGTGVAACPVFANTTARDAVLTSPQNGDMCYVTADGVFYDYTSGAWVARAAGGTFPNGSTTVAGKFQAATVAEQAAHTATGSTGALLVPVVGNFITSSAGVGDAGKLAVVASTGKFDPTLIPSNLQISVLEQTYTFGENIDGTTTPQAVYLKASDGRIYKTVSNVAEGTFKFIGFVTTNVTTGNIGIVIIGGVVPGFTGLTVDSDYYLTVTPGTISTTGSVFIYKVARADTATSILIEPGTKMATGTDDYNTSIATTTDTTITLGFKPKSIQFQYYIQGHESAAQTGNYAQQTGIAQYTETSLKGKQVLGQQFSSAADNVAITAFYMDPLLLTNTTALRMGTTSGSGAIEITVSINSVTDTGFVIRKVTLIGTTPGIARSTILWTAIA